MGATQPVRHGAAAVGSHETPDDKAPQREARASQLGRGLAGVEGGLSYARRADDNPRPKSQIDATDTIKVFDLQDGAQPGAVNGHKPGFMPNHIGFIPSVHYKLTYEAAIEAGLPPDKADELAKLVVKVDDLPGSQDPDHSYMHAMRAPGETMEHYNAATKAYESVLRAMKNIHGLAGLLHRMQDSYSKSHSGPHGPLEWHGVLVEGLILSRLLWHALMDLAPWGGVDRDIVKNSAAQIKDYNNQCGGCLNQ